jgi:hypothetical protein
LIKTNLKKLPYSKYIFLVLFFYFSIDGFSQNEPSILGQDNGSSQLATQDSTGQDTILPKVNTFKTIFNGKPGRAALYSLLIPSGGQIYNKKWWKVPVAIGIDSWFTYQLILKKKLYNQFDKIVIDYQNNIPNADYTLGQAVNNRAQLRGIVESAWVYVVLGHLVTVFDAYVDRHLLDFDISTDLSANPSDPYLENPLITVQLVSFKYNISGK